MKSVFGGNYRAYLGIDFARNINPNWNVGFSFYRWTIDKQIGVATSRGDLNTLSHSYDIFKMDAEPPEKIVYIDNNIDNNIEKEVSYL